MAGANPTETHHLLQRSTLRQRIITPCHHRRYQQEDAGTTSKDITHDRNKLYMKLATHFAVDWCGHTWRFFTLIAAICHFNFVPRLQASFLSAILKSHVIKIAQPDWLTHLAIRIDERTKSQERAHWANAGECNRRYLTCQILAILYADRGDRRKSQSLDRAH